MHLAFGPDCTNAGPLPQWTLNTWLVKRRFRFSISVVYICSHVCFTNLESCQLQYIRKYPQFPQLGSEARGIFGAVAICIVNAFWWRIWRPKVKLLTPDTGHCDTSESALSLSLTLYLLIYLLVDLFLRDIYVLVARCRKSISCFPRRRALMWVKAHRDGLRRKFTSSF